MARRGHQKSEKVQVMEFLRVADLNIDDVLVEPKLFDSSLLPEDMPQLMRDSTAESMKDNKGHNDNTWPTFYKHIANEAFEGIQPQMTPACGVTSALRFRRLPGAQMSDFILHHYAMSPFSEKIRAMLGYTDWHWQSVITREMPPRPLLTPLAGGYRKIPVAQIGADIFCDSRTISTEIAALSGKPALALENVGDDQQQFVLKTDLDIFFACIMSASSKTLNKKVRAVMSWLDIVRFLWDRINMGRKASVRIATPKQAGPLVNAHLAQLEALLTDDFLFGSEPSIADFSAYHSLWFIRDLAERSTIAPYPKINAWMDRIKAFGEGHRSEISAGKALEIARNATPRTIVDAHRQDPLMGKTVRVAPTDYGQTPTQGILVGSTPTQWILSRETPVTGVVHVHFPKQGFTATPL